MIFRTVSFQGDAGKHRDSNDRECGGRTFDVKFAGSAGAYVKQVSCEICEREFVAYENGLGPAPAFPSRR